MKPYFLCFFPLFDFVSISSHASMDYAKLLQRMLIFFALTCQTNIAKKSLQFKWKSIQFRYVFALHKYIQYVEEGKILCTRPKHQEQSTRGQSTREQSTRGKAPKGKAPEGQRERGKRQRGKVPGNKTLWVKNQRAKHRR